MKANRRRFLSAAAAGSLAPALAAPKATERYRKLDEILQQPVQQLVQTVRPGETKPVLATKPGTSPSTFVIPSGATPSTSVIPSGATRQGGAVEGPLSSQPRPASQQAFRPGTTKSEVSTPNNKPLPAAVAAVR